MRSHAAFSMAIGIIPTGWKSGLVFPLWKRKGDRQDSNKYRGVTLFSVPGKVFAQIILDWESVTRHGHNGETRHSMDNMAGHGAAWTPQWDTAEQRHNEMKIHQQGPYPGDPQTSMHPQGLPPGYSVNTSINMAQNAAPPTFMNPPRDHLAWSLFNFMFLNVFCLGYVATVYSIRSRDRRQMNDPMGAANHASTARALNIAATIIALLAILIIIIVVSVSITAMAQIYYNQDGYGGYGGYGGY